MSLDQPEIPESAMPSFKTEQEAIGNIMNKWRNPWAKARTPWVRRYLLNHAFLGGYHYVRHNGYNLTTISRRRKNQVRSVINLLKPTVRTMLSLLTKNRPQWDITAQTGNFVDEAQADVGRNLLRGMWHLTRQPDLNNQLWLHNMKGGNAYKRCAWDPYGGPADEVQMTDEEGFNLYEDLETGDVINEEELTARIASALKSDPDLGEEEVVSKYHPVMDMFPGEVSIDTYSVMEALAPPQYLSLETADVMMWERAHSLDFFRERFGKRGEMVKPEENLVLMWGDGAGSARMYPGIEMAQATGGYHGVRQASTPPVAVLHEILIKPRPTGKNPLVTGGKAPQGIHFMWAGDTPLTELDNPLPYANTPQTEDEDLGFDGVDYRWFPEPGFYSSDYLTDLIPIIRSIDRRDSQTKMTLNAFAHPAILMPMGSKMKTDSVDDSAGKIIKYVGAPPSYLEPPKLQPYVFKIQENDTKNFNDISMLHEVMRQGSVPPQVRTAAGLRLLQEIDSLALAHTITMYEESEGRLGQMILDRVKQFYPEERIVNFVGDRRRLEVQIFKREPFFRNRWKVYVHPGSAFPELRAAKVAESLEIMQFAPWMLVNPSTGLPDKRLFASMMGREEFDELIADMDESRQAADAENVLLGQGEQLQVFPFEEHDVHLMQHYAVMRSPDFRLMDQAIQTAFFEHSKEHEQALTQAAQAQAQSAGMIQNAANSGAQAVATQAAAEAAASEARDLAKQEFEGGGEGPPAQAEQAVNQIQGGGLPQ